MIDLKQGDCLELMKDIPDNSIDMILCDLPYGTTNNKWDKKIDIKKLFQEYERIVKREGATVLFSQQPFTTELVTAWKKCFRYEWVWVKSLKAGFLNAKKMPLRQHEIICVFYDKLPTYNPQGLIRLDKPIHSENCKNRTTNYHRHDAPYTTTHKNYPNDVLFFENSNYKSLHPTQKPVPLLEYLIRTYTNEGETVLDNCMGSGSTGVACVNTNRNFIGFELDEHYFEIAKKRIEEAQTALSNQGGISIPEKR